MNEFKSKTNISDYVIRMKARCILYRIWALYMQSPAHKRPHLDTKKNQDSSNFHNIWKKIYYEELTS